MSANNSEMITLYFFISAFLLGCGCHICQKCSHTNQRIQLDTQDQDVEMDSITNVLYTNNIINELDHFSIVPKMDNYSNKDECVICTEKMEEQQVRILKLGSKCLLKSLYLSLFTPPPLISLTPYKYSSDCVR
mgnify:CR=1 FL=1